MHRWQLIMHYIVISSSITKYRVIGNPSEVLQPQQRVDFTASLMTRHDAIVSLVFEMSQASKAEAEGVEQVRSRGTIRELLGDVP